MRTIPPVAPASVACKLLDLAAELGADRSSLADAAGLQIDDVATSIPHATLIALWEIVIKTLHDPSIPLLLASRHDLADYEVLAMLCMTSENRLSALKRLIRYYRLWTTNSHWTLETNPKSSVLVFTMAGEARLGIRCEIEYSLAELVSALRGVAGNPTWHPIEVTFRHAAPEDTSAHCRYFAAPVRFKARRDELVMETPPLEAALPKHDPLLSTFFERHAAELLAALPDDDDQVGTVRRAIADRLPDGVPTLGRVAVELGVSPRTLRRRLSDHGVTFRGLVDETRRQLARRYFADEHRSLKEVAFLLGFSEPSAFHRAFRRWNGCTPTAYRARQT